MFIPLAFGRQYGKITTYVHFLFDSLETDRITPALVCRKSIKIIDLGVAITLPYGREELDPIGTLAYIAPEIFQHNPYAHKIDVWSIGILLYFLSTGGTLPFDDEKGDEKIIGKKIVFTHQEYPDKYFGNKSKALICLIDKALEKTPEKRITINEFLKEEWLNKYSK